MRDIPLSVFLTFPRPNYVNPETRGSALLIVNAVLISIVTVIVALRLYTRLYLKRQFGLDDAFMIPAFIFAVGLTAVVLLANLRYGWNRHVWDIPFQTVPSAGKIAFAAKLMFTFAATFTRVSLMCFYYRLAGPAGLTRFSWAIHASQALNLAICISFVALVIWQCDPIESYWVFPPMPGRRCLNEGTLTLGCGIINCFADFLTTLLPIPLVARLRMPLRERVGVILLLGLGLVVTLAGCVRTYFIWKSLVASYDQTWFAYPLWLSAAVEIDLAVVCACAPALRPLARTFLARTIRRRLSESAEGLTTRLNESWDAAFRRSGDLAFRSHSHPSIIGTSERDSRKSSAKSAAGGADGNNAGGRRGLVVMRQRSFKVSSFVMPDPLPPPPVPPTSPSPVATRNVGHRRTGRRRVSEVAPLSPREAGDGRIWAGVTREAPPVPERSVLRKGSVSRDLEKGI